MKIKNLFFASALLFTACTQPQTEKLTSHVNPLIGSGGHGHVFVGAHVPFGMVQLGPTSVTTTWDWCSGYHQDENSVIGFSHTHLSGTGIGDLFDVTVMPVTGDVTYARGILDDEKSGLWSPADRTKEVAKPGYYAVPLTRYNINAEMTSTARVGYHRYTFPCSQESALVFDLENGGCWDESTETFMEAEGNNTIVGYRYSKGWAKDQKIYFVAQTSKPFDKFELHGYKNMYGRASFATDNNEAVILKVAISPVNIEGAKAAMQAEASHWDFDKIAKAADEAWEKELGKIRIQENSVIPATTFYTAMYHAMTAPILFNDINGDYRGADGNIYNAKHNTYSIFSLWDTYRAKMPLMSIIQSERMGDFIATMLDICDKQGRLPVWHLWGCETDCMIGDPGIPIVADAIVKGIKGFDKKRAYEAIKKTLAHNERGRDLRRQHGYIPCDLFKESVAFDMEYAIADGAAAQAAAALGYNEESMQHTRNSHSYRHFFDPSTGLVRGKKTTGEFNEPFNPFFSAHRDDDYCEGNAWQYTWLVPQDVAGMANCFGGKEKMLAQLDSLFNLPSVIEGDPSPDISGLIGQFAHGNEPSHHILYMYTMLGEPHKAAERIREVLCTLYDDSVDGLSGNEDVGQMSAWYILSALGFYEVEPAGGRYWFGTPSVANAELEVEGGVFKIETENMTPENVEKNIYIQSVKLNGEEYNLPYINHSDIKAGNKLTFTMGDTPAKWYDKDITD
ncbi:MAG: glycoside hydrolase family 92 protein [Bacteroidales bacterium]|nr:glycoside hydrolase family 92 protein [Bacteroidales bacterium]